jgi:hypothetical protein
LKTLAVDALSDQESPVKFAGLTMIYPLVIQNPHQNKDIVKKLVDILWQILDHKFPK